MPEAIPILAIPPHRFRLRTLFVVVTVVLLLNGLIQPAMQPAIECNCHDFLGWTRDLEREHSEPTPPATPE